MNGISNHTVLILGCARTPRRYPAPRRAPDRGPAHRAVPGGDGPQGAGWRRPPRHSRRDIGNPAGLEAALSRTSRSEEHTSELQSRQYLVCRLLLEKKKKPTTSLPSL